MIFTCFEMPRHCTDLLQNTQHYFPALRLALLEEILLLHTGLWPDRIPTCLLSSTSETSIWAIPPRPRCTVTGRQADRRNTGRPRIEDCGRYTEHKQEPNTTSRAMVIRTPTIRTGHALSSQTHTMGRRQSLRRGLPRRRGTDQTTT